MSSTGNREAWADFWGQHAGQTASGCLPQALEQIEAAQRAMWQGFARELKKGARVLDLGTGDGAVLKKMLKVRTDLVLTGVDSSPRLPPHPKGISLRAEIAIESLPFEDASVDAVTSQFGYEYGDTRSASMEVARVLRSGGRLLLAVHRRDGPIVAHNLPRRDALRWVLSPGGHVEKARNLISARRAAPLPTPPAFRSAPDEATRLFPGQSVGAEFLQALLQTLELGRNRPPRESLEVLQQLESKARNEIARIDSLDRAACDAPRIERLIAELRSAGIRLEAPGVLTERSSGRPFAWLVSGLR